METTETIMATGIFPNKNEVNAFLEVLVLSGLRRYLTQNPEDGIEEYDGEFHIALHIAPRGHFIMRGALDEEGPLEQWKNMVTFHEAVA